MGQTTIRRKSWASWFPIKKVDEPFMDFVTDGPPMFVIGEGSVESYGWPLEIATNRKRWGMKP